MVLAAVLLFSSLGSLSTSRIREESASKEILRSAFLLTAVLAIYGISLTPLLQVIANPGLGLKVLLSLLLIFPPAFLMGRLFPLGVKALPDSGDSIFPWAWGLNGASSVLGSILSMFAAVSWGFSSAWWAFTFVYLLAGVFIYWSRSV